MPLLTPQLTQWCAGRRRSARMTCWRDGLKWIVELSAGAAIVMLRACPEKLPWLTYRRTVRNEYFACFDFAMREDYVLSFIRKLSRPAASDVAVCDPVDPDFSKSHAALHEHLASSVDAEGKRRQTCSLTVYGVPGRFKGFLNDRDSGGAIGVEAGTFYGILEALEAELESDNPSWFWREGAKGGPRTKKGKGG